MSDEFKNSKIKGVITDKYRDKMQHNVPLLIYRDSIDSKEINISSWIGKSDLWEFVSIGDSLIKTQGSENIIIVKNGIRKEYKFRINSKSDTK
ncbi:MAG: hypothetical protein M0D57_07765 [Sphingobacteriales bacterium JAD_PAG50586_3]|nr:MAG: hypothetical protein M0D57_07765 [Sphingobacteriales bacterium JAD_PAG50586_3]